MIVPSELGDLMIYYYDKNGELLPERGKKFSMLPSQASKVPLPPFYEAPTPENGGCLGVRAERLGRESSEAENQYYGK